MESLDHAALGEFALRAQAGDSAALTRLLEELQPGIYYTLLKMTGRAADAEDLTQEVYILILENLHTLKDPRSVSRWARMIAVNTCKNFWAKQKRAPFTVDEGEELLEGVAEEDVDALPGEYMDMYAKRDMITGMIDALPEKQRVTLYLFYYDELSVEEIARLMEVSPGTVKSRLAAARAGVKLQVEEEERKGNKLYVFFPFLGRLLQEEARSVQLPPLPVAAEQINAAAGIARNGAAKIGLQAGEKAASGTVAKAAGGAAVKGGLGMKLAAGVAAVAILGGAAVGLPRLTGGEKAEASPGTAESQPAAPAPTAATPAPEQTAEPAPEPSEAPEQALDPTGFDPVAMLGQELSAMIALCGEPNDQPSDTERRWTDPEGSYDFWVILFTGTETIRDVMVIQGPDILGAGFGDSEDAAQAALDGLGSPYGVVSHENGPQTVYTVTSPDESVIYQMGCIDGSVIYTTVNVNTPET